MGELRARTATLNCRRSSYLPDKLIRSRYWPNRRPHLVQTIKEVDPSIIGTQECTRDQAHDITHDLGPNFSYFGGDGPGNGPVIWNGSVWDAIEGLEEEIEAPGERYLVAVRLASRPPKNPGQVWVVTCHLTAGSTNLAIENRHKQISALIRRMQRLPDWQHSAIYGDFNSDGYNNSPLGGVRTRAAELGFKDLRTVLRNDEVKRYNYSSFNGWKTTPKNERWIDDILCPTAIVPYYASLHFTHNDDGAEHGSDHNLIRASLAWQGGN